MTAQALEVQKRLKDEEFEAKRQSSCSYVEQLEQADRAADKGWMQRAADLTDLYEDSHWIEEMRVLKPIEVQRRPGQRKEAENSRKRFYWWAEHRVVSPTSGQPLGASTAEELLDLHAVVRAAGPGGPGSAPGEVGRKALKPLVTFVKKDRHDEVPEVWNRARKLADGQEPGPALVAQAIAEHNRTLTSKPPASKQTLDSYENRIRRDWDFLVRHADPERCRVLHRELADRFKQEVRWAKGEQWTA